MSLPLLNCATGQSSSILFLPTYATATATRIKVMRLKNLKKLLGKTEIEFSSRINEIAYLRDNAFSLADKISTFVFGLQLAIRTIVAQ